MSEEKDMEALRLLRAFSRIVDSLKRRELIGLVRDAANLQMEKKRPGRQSGRPGDKPTRTNH
jgi:hypothetical protein